MKVIVYLAIAAVLFSAACGSSSNPQGKDAETTADQADNKQQQQTLTERKPKFRKDTVLDRSGTEVVMTKSELPDTVEVVRIATAYGDMLVWLFDETPVHKQNFLEKARNKAYDNTTFHRVIQNFMIQGGDPLSKDNDPTNDGKGGQVNALAMERVPELNHRFGAVAAARYGDQVNPERKSNDAQFYIVNNPKGVPHLDGQYTIFGQVFDGKDVIRKISAQPTAGASRPVQDIPMQVRVVRMPSQKMLNEYKFNPKDLVD